MKKHILMMIMLCKLIESADAMDAGREKTFMQAGNATLSLNLQVGQQVGYEKYHHVLFPDKIIDLIVQEKELYNQCVAQKLLAVDRSSVLQTSQNILNDQEHLMSYAIMYGRRKQDKNMTPEKWKIELDDLTNDLEKNISKYAGLLATAAEGFFEVTPSQVRMAERSYREGQSLVSARQRKPAMKRWWESYAPGYLQEYVANEGPQVVQDLQNVLDQYCTLKNAQMVVGQGLHSLGYGMRVACRLMMNAQKVIQEAVEAEARQQQQ